jgi:hypothetical protein
MKRFVFALLVFALFAAPALPSAAGGLSQIRVNDTTKDAWVWVTAYEKVPFGREIRRVWCVSPEENSSQKIGSIIDEVRVEVTHQNCAHPVYLDATLSTSGGLSSGGGLIIRSFEVRGSNGRYAFSTIGNQ